MYARARYNRNARSFEAVRTRVQIPLVLWILWWVKLRREKKKKKKKKKKGTTKEKKYSIEI